MFSVSDMVLGIPTPSALNAPQLTTGKSDCQDRRRGIGGERDECFGDFHDPMQRLPTLVLDDGTAIAELMAICRYFEALHPDPPLFGRSPLDSALVEMWNRRAEFHLLAPVATVFQHLHPYMKRMVDPQVPAWGEANKPRIFEFLQFLDGELGGRPYVAGAEFTVADITALAAADFMKLSKLVIPDDLGNVRRWREAVSARPSAAA
jgi:glutathione S-transferase